MIAALEVVQKLHIEACFRALIVIGRSKAAGRHGEMNDDLIKQETFLNFIMNGLYP